MEPSVQDSSLRHKATANHLCVLIHGLWGTPKHLDYVASAIRDKYGEGSLQILGVKSNMGNLTCDGIEVGGERVAHEIEESIRDSSKNGCTIKKLSIVGYSLGGLVGRYAVGLLFSRGYFDKIEPINFTTFATPHVGVRSPRMKAHLWNVLGARTLSTSGRQLFMIDSFRDTGKSLLSILAAPGSIFMLGLAKFKHRSLYANVVNDRSAVFYTTGVSKIDPFADLDKIDISYVKGYAPVVVDPTQKILLKSETESVGVLSRLTSRIKAISNLPPFIVLLWIFIPVATVLFLMNSVIQTVRSRKRIRLHEEGSPSVFYKAYRVPLIVDEFRNVVEGMYETVNATHEPEFISDDADSSTPQSGHHGDDGDSFGEHEGSESAELSSSTLSLDDVAPDESDPLCKARSGEGSVRRRGSSRITARREKEETAGSHFPTLALTPSQFEIIDSLNSVGFRKYPVYIHNARHSHAAIIVRMPKKIFAEGKTVVKHWLDEEFCL